MKTVLRNIFIVLSACMLLAGCSRPKTIPDDKLEQIFEEVFLVNSYYNTAGNRAQLDTMDIYRPILEKYGYRVSDMTYTIENYSKRKSAKISDLVENTIRRLEAGERRYTELVAVRDTIQARAIRQFARTVYHDTAISVTQIADTSRLRIEIPVVPGDYTIKYRYKLDSLDQNGHARSLYELYNEHWYRTSNSAQGLNVRRSTYHTATMTAKEYDRTLVLKLAGYSPDMKRPHVYIDSIRVTYNPPIAVAVDSLVQYNARKAIKLPDQYAAPEKNSGARFVNPPRLPQRGMITLDADGAVLEVSAPDNPDSMPGVEFYSGILVPGMVNAHTHLELSYLRGAIRPGCGFVGFAAGLRESRNRFTEEDIAGAIDYWDARMWADGVQAVGDICNGRSTFAVKGKSRVYYHSFVELFGLGSGGDAAGRAAVMAGELRAAGLAASVTPHSTYSLNEQGFRLAVGGADNAPLSIHFMESPGETELYEGRGEMREWYDSAGMRTDFTSLYRSPAERVAALVPSERKVLLVHNTLIGEGEIERLAARFGANLTFVVCPLSNAYITGLTPPLELLRRSGVRIAVGTDSLASNRSLSMVDELKAMSGVPLEDALAWATIGGARALGIDGWCGSFEVGKRPGVVLLSGIDWNNMSLRSDARTERLV